MSYHYGQYFSTIDRKNDYYQSNYCAVSCKGGWWYNYCYNANLNGVHDGYTNVEGIYWLQWHSYYYSLPFVEMKTYRPLRAFYIRIPNMDDTRHPNDWS